MSEETDGTERESGPGTKDRVDLLLKSIVRFDAQITNTNSKAALILAWNGAVLAAIVLRATEILQPYSSGSWQRVTTAVLLSLIGLLGAISSLLAFRVVYPYLSDSAKNSNAKITKETSLFFFGSVAEGTHGEYSRSWREADYNSLLDDLCDQSVVLAKGIKSKMKHLQKSFIVLATQLFLMLSLALFKVFA
jgi:hypothetical protein